jgi:HPr kinase/phosphorylase
VTIANIHASCIVCAGAGAAFGTPSDGGVLLLGDSGSGKSDLALRLVAMGAGLVADDRCEIFFDGTTLRARPPRTIAGLMEIHGVGVVALPFVPEARIALVVRASETHPQRLPERRRYRPPPIIALPQHLCPPEIFVHALAASAPAKILAAVAAFDKQLFREEIAT